MNWEERLILIAEDSDDDYFLLDRAFKKAGIKNPLHRASTGQDVVHYLSGASPYSDRTAYPFPYLLLLDLKMPIKHGFEVLKWIRERAEMKALPVVILSSSQQSDDIQKGYKAGANGYVSKSTTVNSLAETVSAIHIYWIKVNCAEPAIRD